jgi:hypothetical protein
MNSTYSEEAETARALIMNELAKFQTITSPLSGRHVGRLSSPEQRELSVSYPAVTSMVSIIEQFAVHSLELRLDEIFIETTEVSLAARNSLLRQVEQSWDNRHKALRRWFEGSLTPEPKAKVAAFVEARNAITHGLGRLTRRQLGNDGGKALKAQLAVVGISESGGRVHVPSSSVVTLAESGRSLMTEWDIIARSSELKVAIVSTAT